MYKVIEERFRKALRHHIHARYKVDVPIVGDVKEVLAELLAQLEASHPGPGSASTDAWWHQIQQWRAHETEPWLPT